MSKKIKLYKFYKTPNKEDLSSLKDIKLKEKYNLYAFTTKKEFAKRFLEERDMESCFIYNVSKVTESEYRRFYNKNTMLELDMVEYTDVKDPYGECKEVDIQVLSTRHEKTVIDDYVEYVTTDVVSNKMMQPIFINLLKERYLKVLLDLKLLPLISVHGEFIDETFEFDMEDQYEEILDLDYNYFNIYLYIFGYTFS